LDLLDKHKAELADKTALDAGMEPIQTDIDVVTPEVEHQQHQQELQQPPPPPSEKEKKLEKAKRKKKKQKEKERLVQEELAEMDANAGPSMRQLELELLDAQLLPLALKISEIQSDGNCLYRAVAAQCGMDYIKVRECYNIRTYTTPIVICTMCVSDAFWGFWFSFVFLPLSQSHCLLIFFLNTHTHRFSLRGSPCSKSR
jgi:hypothetical protein